MIDNKIIHLASYDLSKLPVKIKYESTTSGRFNKKSLGIDLEASSLDNLPQESPPTSKVYDLVSILDQKTRLSKLRSKLPGKNLSDDIIHHQNGGRRILRRGESLWILTSSEGDIISEHVLVNPSIYENMNLILDYLLDLRYLPFLRSGYYLEYDIDADGVESFLILPEVINEIKEFYGPKCLGYPTSWCLTRRSTLSSRESKDSSSSSSGSQGSDPDKAG